MQNQISSISFWVSSHVPQNTDKMTNCVAMLDVQDGDSVTQLW